LCQIRRQSGAPPPGTEKRPHDCLTLRTLPSCGTTCCGGCPEISGARQKVSLAQAETLPVLHVFPPLGSWLRSEVFRGLHKPPLDPSPSLPRLPHCLYLEARPFPPALPVFPFDHPFLVDLKDNGSSLAPLPPPSEPAVLVQGFEAPEREVQNYPIPRHTCVKGGHFLGLHSGKSFTQLCDAPSVRLPPTAFLRRFCRRTLVLLR